MRDRFDGSDFKGSPTRCQVAGCFAGTRHGKPWCPEHVDHSPIAQRIKQELDQREREITDAVKGKLTLDSHLLREAVLAMGDQTISVERLARDLHVPHNTARGIFNFMFKKRLAREGRTRRGATTATLRLPARQEV